MDPKLIKQFEITEDMMFKSDDEYNSYKTPEEPDLIWWEPNTHGDIKYPIVIEKYLTYLPNSKEHIIYSKNEKSQVNS